MKSLVTLNFTIFLFFLLRICNGYEYIAGVIEYNPFTNESEAQKNIEYNIAAYKKEIELLKARNTQIIVFPEYGLSGKTLDTSYAQHVPKLSVERVDYKDNIERLSDIAYEHSVAIAVNVMEYEDVNGKIYYFNTEVVFDKNGQIVAKHRKINLNDAEKKVLTPGTNATTIVEIDNNKFGVLINEDMFSLPPKNSNNSDNLVGYLVSSSWKNKFPFEIATSIQAGFAIANEIPVIAANLNSPSDGISGSGIYYYKKYPIQSSSITGITGISRNMLYVKGENTKEILYKSLRGLPSSDPLDTLNIGYDFKNGGKFEDIGNTTFVCLTNNICCNLDIDNHNEQIKKNYRVGIIRYKIQIGQEKFDSEICALLKFNRTTKKVERSRSNFTLNRVKLTFDDQPSYKTLPLTLDYNLNPLNVTFRRGNKLIELEGENLNNIVLYGIQRLTKSSAMAVKASIVFVFSVFVALYSSSL